MCLKDSACILGPTFLGLRLSFLALSLPLSQVLPPTTMSSLWSQRRRVAERGRWWTAFFFGCIPAGEGEQRLMGGRWHGGVQQWVSLNEGQDVVREISGRGEQGSYTYSCTGSWPGGHMGRGSLRAGGWDLGSVFPTHMAPFHTHTTASLPSCSLPVPLPTITGPSPGPGRLSLSFQSHFGSRH